MAGLTEALLEWFQQRGRALPWRRERTPYRVWVAEVMLQQTQAATVAAHFDRWLVRFPDLASLAAAPLDEVLKTWEGLGYYRRARLLHQAARAVMRQGGRLPETEAAWLELPGVGAYTAAAVASLAFGERALAIDGNVRRVAARLFVLPGKPSDAAVREALGPLLPARAGEFNEALMDLGATLCTPRAPRCQNCPLQGYCAAYAQGRVADFPERQPRRPLPLLKRVAPIYRLGDGLWLYKRPERAMLGGLWGFPLSDEAPTGEALAPVHHAYSHFRLTVQPVLVRGQPQGEGRFVARSELSKLALSTLDHKLLARLTAFENAANAQ